MKTLLSALAASLALASAAEAQTAGPCMAGHRWSGGDGTARFATCNGDDPVLTLACDGSDTIRGTVQGAPGSGALTARGEAAPLSLRRSDLPGRVVFDLPRDWLGTLSRAFEAEIATPDETRTIHLTGSAVAIAAMLDTCRAPEGNAAPDDPDSAPDPDSNQPPEGSPVETGTAPEAEIIAAFRTAWAAPPPDAPEAGAPAPARCDALAGGPVAGFGSDSPVPFAALAESTGALAACEAAMAAEPDAPRHAFHAARLHLAQGDDAAALALIRQASGAGYPPAANALALAILAGRTAPEPGEETAALFSLAAEADYPPALANLAIGGTNAGPLADHATALGFARRAAALGDPVAATLIGNMAFYGTGLPDDITLATRWYRIGAARGDPDALVALADVLGSGDGPGQDYRDAAMAAGHRTTILAHGLYAPGSVPEARMVEALGADPVRHGWEDGLLYLGPGRDSDGALYWTLMWPRRAGADWDDGAVDRAPLLDALAARYDCAEGRLFKLTEARLGCAR